MAERSKNYVFENIATYISDRIDLRYNTVRVAAEYRQRGEDKFALFTDRERNGMYISLKESNGFECTKADFDLYVNSDRIPSFDPYVSFFESLPKWDGEDRFKQLAKYIKVEDTPQYNFAWQLKKWLVRSIKCALEANYFNKQMLILVGENQNKGKTTFCRWLCPPELSEYWSEESSQGKDESIQLASNFMILYDELAKLTKASEAEIKATLSKTLIKYRPPYARTEQSFTRRCSFIGTCNFSEFLSDPTGSVRYLAWTCNSIDFRYNEIDRNQLYAQAYHLYKTDFACDMTQRDIDLQAEYNQRFMVQTTEQDMIQQYLRPAQASEPYGSAVYLWSSGQILQFLQDNIGSLKLSAVTLGRSLKMQGYRQIIDGHNARRAYAVCLATDTAYVNDVLQGYKANG